MKTRAFLHLRLWVLCVLIFASCKNEPAQAIPQNVVSSTPVQQTPRIIEDDMAGKVYVCESSNATKYHADNSCHCLKRCKHEIVTMNKKQAENMGLGLCGYED